MYQLSSLNTDKVGKLFVYIHKKHKTIFNYRDTYNITS